MNFVSALGQFICQKLLANCCFSSAENMSRLATSSLSTSAGPATSLQRRQSVTYGASIEPTNWGYDGILILMEYPWGYSGIINVDKL